MTDGRLRLASAALALAGAAIAGYLLYARASGSAILCATGGCETVQSSSYAEVFGVPVAALGLVGYLALFALALLGGELARQASAVIALGALGFGAYLLVVQLAVIGAICQWCVASDLITTALAAIALVRLRVPLNPRGSPRDAPPRPQAPAARRA